MSTFVSPIPPRPRARLMPTASEMLGGFRPKQDSLFSSEEGGREELDDPVNHRPGPGGVDPARFGYSYGTATGQTDDRAARAGVLSRGYNFDQLSDPGADRRAERNAEIGILNAIAGEGDEFIPAAVPTSRESALEREYLESQVAPQERRDARREEDIAASRAGIMADSAAAAAVQRQAAKLAWEETYKMPYSEEAAKDIAEQVRKNDEDAGLMADLADMKADMDAEIEQVSQLYPQAKAVVDPLDTAGSSAANAQRTALQRETDAIRQRYMLDMNHLLTIRTRRNIEMGKKGQAPPVTEDDLVNLGAR